jgi:hypothetical protein
MSFLDDIKNWDGYITGNENETDEQYCRRMTPQEYVRMDYRPNDPDWVATRKAVADRYQANFNACMLNRAGSKYYFTNPSDSSLQTNLGPSQTIKNNSFIHPLLKYGLLKKK